MSPKDDAVNEKVSVIQGVSRPTNSVEYFESLKILEEKSISRACVVHGRRLNLKVTKGKEELTILLVFLNKESTKSSKVNKSWRKKR